MFWKEKPLSYDICIPQRKKPAEEMTHREMEAFFQWSMSVLPERIEYLSSRVCENLHLPRERLTLSEESLIPLWEWFLSTAEIEDSPETALQWFWEHDTHPEPFRRILLEQRRRQFSLETEYILQDIGRYWGEVFVKTVPGITWTYYEKPKSDFFVNKPVLQGFADFNYDPPFRMFFEPVHMAHVQAARLMDNSQKPEDLLRVYKLWREKSIQLHHYAPGQPLDQGYIRSVRGEPDPPKKRRKDNAEV